ncbi:MAG: ATP-binding protein [Gemmatimonadaceae bacterium]
MRTRAHHTRGATAPPAPAPGMPQAGLLEEVSDWAVGADAEGRVAFVNRAAREALGEGVGALVGRPMSELVDHADRTVLHDALTRALLGVEGTPAAPVSATLTVADARVAVSGVVQQVRWRGEVAGAVMLVRPEGARADARLQASFVSLLGHELRTPLTTLRGALGLMKAPLGDADHRSELLRLALSGAERLQALVEDWLDLADADAGRLCLMRGRLAPADVVGAAAERARGGAERRRVCLTSEVRTERALWADGARLGRVLNHLLENAVSAAPRGTAVSLLAEDAPCGGVRLTVRDEGPGIPAAELEAVFGPFVRLDTPGWQRAGGLGVGLALCRALIEQHGGLVGADSAPGRTVVWCDLPSAR